MEFEIQIFIQLFKKKFDYYMKYKWGWRSKETTSTLVVTSFIP